MIKENIFNGTRIISAEKPNQSKSNKCSIIHLDRDFNLFEKITAKEVDIKK